jgi:DNA (cytosine-5)-methyltransferase 1
MAHKFISFFSGALGLDLGMELAGFEHLAANEFDPKACATIRQNRPDLKLYDFDIRELSAEQILQDLGLGVGELFLLTGGPPCQAFSTAGKRLGFDDERGNVFLHFIELIGALQPKYVVIENVRGLLSTPLAHRPHNQRGQGFDPLEETEKSGGVLRHVIDLLAQNGYLTSFNLYNTAMFGVPQKRERVILFGVREGELIPDLVPTHDEFARHSLKPWTTVREAIGDLPAKHDYVKFSEKRLKYLEMLEPGQNWRNLPADLQPEAMGKSFLSGGGKTGFYRRLPWDKPAPTLVTSPTMPATYLAHPKESRPLSIQEYARIQTFPDSWKFSGDIHSVYRQIGNAVPVDFGSVVARHIADFDDGKLDLNYASPVPFSRYKGTSHIDWWKRARRHDEKLTQLNLV